MRYAPVTLRSDDDCNIHVTKLGLALGLSQRVIATGSFDFSRTPCKRCDAAPTQHLVI